MNPVLEWLHQHDGYSFDEGVAVLLCYSSNANTNRMIMSRRDRRHLNTELARLAHIPNLRPIPGMELPQSQVKPQIPQNEETNKSEETHEKTSDSVENGDNPSTDENGEETVTLLDLQRHEQYDPEKLPPALKELWMKNREEYKELQYCHAMMKEANSDAGRADWRRQVFEHRASLQHRWKLFDEEMARLKEEAGRDEEKSYNPFNDRSYLAKALKKETWTDEMKLEVQRRTSELLGHNIPIKEETLQRLKERGISV